jgi:hypothetical protein
MNYLIKKIEQEDNEELNKQKEQKEIERLMKEALSNN